MPSDCEKSEEEGKVRLSSGSRSRDWADDVFVKERKVNELAQASAVFMCMI